MEWLIGEKLSSIEDLSVPPRVSHVPLKDVRRLQHELDPLVPRGVAPSRDTREGGVGGGVEVGANVNWTFLNVRSAGTETKTEAFATNEKQCKEKFGFTKTYDNVDPDEIVPNPYACPLVK